MNSEQIFWLKGHKTEFQEDDFERSFDIYVKEPDTINENTGLFLISEGLGGLASSPSLVQMRERWSNRYNVVTLGVNYFGSRSFNKSAVFRIKNDMVDKLFNKLTEEQKDDYKSRNSNNPFDMLRYLKGQDLASEIFVHEVSDVNKEQIRDYFDYGYIQTIDCLCAVKYVLDMYKSKGKRLNAKRIFAYGVSFGGQLAQLCSKFAPNTFSLVADVSGYAFPERASMRPDSNTYQRTQISGVMLGKFKGFYYESDKNSKYYVTDDMLKIRTLCDKAHINTYKQHFKGKIIMFHGADDKLVDVKSKIALEKLYKKNKIDCVHYIFSEKDTDGEIIKSSGHAMDCDPIKLFEKYCEKYALESNQGWIKKEALTDFDIGKKIVYPAQYVNYVIDYSDTFPTITPAKIVNSFKRK
ncbi:MAG: DUF2920 family protein [Deferribacteraceae bacterium]|jgi:dienelactone hydrolase|nr:DUF2920 family protein [Deferribacteraceae bacterium]